nr:farnesol dehydrogenase-like [Nomia melanderi]
MKRWHGKLAIVTGASAGIGAATARFLVNDSVRVVGLARRKDKLDELAAELGKDKFYPVECDIRNEEDVLKAFKWIEEKLGGADILVNNAAVAEMSKIIEMSADDYRKTLETNVVAPAVCAREFVQSIKKRKAVGHLVNINSMAGHFAELIQIPIGMYGASKYALNALTIELRHEIKETGLDIKVTSISPGAVLTDLLRDAIKVQEIIDKIPKLSDKDVADAVIYALGTPQGVEVQELFIVPQNIGADTLNIMQAMQKSPQKK